LLQFTYVYRPKSVPPYLQRKNFVPSGIEDFGDGGAFPEIHVVQYPLDMGKPGAVSSAIVAVTVGESGLVKFDAIVKQGSNRNRIVQSSLDDIKAKEADKDMLALPQDKEEQETAEKTRLALEVLLGGKVFISHMHIYAYIWRERELSLMIIL
jgi:SNW domain-containing protein 1